MLDHHHGDQPVAVKCMPNDWVCADQRDFELAHPDEIELPWNDIGCSKFLQSVAYPFGCQLEGVYKDKKSTYVVSAFASEGDLFAMCEDDGSPGPDREEIVAPLIIQILSGVQRLHDMGIAHRDLSLENILLTRDCSKHAQSIRIIDFGVASTRRRQHDCVRGKVSYQAPEQHQSGVEYDVFLCDVFALGVTLYAMAVKDYPWFSTKTGKCKCFDYAHQHGFQAYLSKRQVRNTQYTVSDIMSQPLKQLLEGMLAFNPSERLTLGGSSWPSSRKSVWQDPWIQQHMSIDKQMLASRPQKRIVTL
jgi:serine/threonine protein kinase